MGKKGSWLSAIKRVFLPSPSPRPNSNPPLSLKDSDKNSAKDKKKRKGLGKLRRGDASSFLPPLFREPSSVEKIFGDFERDHHTPSLLTPPHPPPRVLSSPPRASSPSPPPPPPPPTKIILHNPPQKDIRYRGEPSLRNHHASATKIQAAYRGFMARRSFRALKGLVRLQGAVRGQNVKRQTANAMKYMQLVVRVQSQIQARRIHMLESQARRHLDYDAASSAFGKWNLNVQSSEAGHGDWDDSVLTKEEVDVRMQKKVEAIVKRERATAYAYSHQVWKASPKSNQTPLADIRGGGFPWWYNWLERQLPQVPETPNFEQLRMPRAQRQQPHYDMMETPTPRSSKSNIVFATKLATAKSPLKFPAKDNESLTSCPAFSGVPNYMVPTESAKAKARAISSPKERPSSANSKRRLSFPLGQGIGSFKWNKGASYFSSASNNSNSPVSTSRRTFEKHHSLLSDGNMSVDSPVSNSMMGRKPFNRFV